MPERHIKEIDQHSNVLLHNKLKGIKNIIQDMKEQKIRNIQKWGDRTKKELET